MQILITGGCGFIGHHYVDYVLQRTDWNVVVVDALTYAASGYDRLRDIGALDNPRVRVFPLDFSHGFGVGAQKEFGVINYLVHMGAQTHVDRSIADPLSFVQANVVGTTQVLEFARTCKGLRKMVYFSTDEVFGPAESCASFDEWDRYNSGNPYAASKAGGEEMCLAYANTYGVPVSITHSMNVFGPRQHPEKFIPLVVRKLLGGETLQLHCDAERHPCSRRYLHVQNVCDAVHTVLVDGETREKYNISIAEEVSNLALAKIIARIANRPLQYELVDNPRSRPGVDTRYCLNSTNLRALGWPEKADQYVHFEIGIRETVQWMLEHPEELRSCGSAGRHGCRGNCAASTARCPA